MLSQKIPNLSAEFTTPIADDAADSDEIFDKRFGYIEQLARVIEEQISKNGSGTDLSRIVLKHLEDPDADTSDDEDLMIGLVSMIYESNLIVAGFSKEDYDIANQMAEDYFNTEDGDGVTQFQRSSEITVGMDIYTVAFILAQELINAVNTRITEIPLHAHLVMPESRTIN
jgi:hypothetical protein